MPQPRYRIAKRGRGSITTVRVRLGGTVETLTVLGGDVASAVHARAGARAPELLRTVPLRVHLIRSEDGVERGGPGLVVERMAAQLAQDATVEHA
tara:strand:+ start:6814 stop:7098 length:285 start_codon:yes stop_codon:yes gene_type:complete